MIYLELAAVPGKLEQGKYGKKEALTLLCVFYTAVRSLRLCIKIQRQQNSQSPAGDV